MNSLLLLPTAPVVQSMKGFCVEHVDKALDPRSLGLGFDSPAPITCKSLGKVLNQHYLCPPRSNGYQVECKIDTVRMAPAAENVLHSPQGDGILKE